MLKKSAGEFMVRRKPVFVHPSTTIQEVLLRFSRLVSREGRGGGDEGAPPSRLRGRCLGRIQRRHLPGGRAELARKVFVDRSD